MLAGREPGSRGKMRYVEQPALVDLKAGLPLAAPTVGVEGAILHVRVASACRCDLRNPFAVLAPNHVALDRLECDQRRQDESVGACARS